MRVLRPLRFARVRADRARRVHVQSGALVSPTSRPLARHPAQAGARVSALDEVVEIDLVRVLLDWAALRRALRLTDLTDDEAAEFAALVMHEMEVTP
jgi:hypothetical protein